MRTPVLVVEGMGCKSISGIERVTSRITHRVSPRRVRRESPCFLPPSLFALHFPTARPWRKFPPSPILAMQKVSNFNGKCFTWKHELCECPSRTVFVPGESCTTRRSLRTMKQGNSSCILVFYLDLTGKLMRLEQHIGLGWSNMACATCSLRWPATRASQRHPRSGSSALYCNIPYQMNCRPVLAWHFA